MGIDRSELSSKLQRKVVYAGSNPSSFRQGSEDLAEYLDLEINAKQVERVTERIGQERCHARDKEVADYMGLPLTQRKNKPEGVTPPEVAVVGVDGGRVQIRDESWPGSKKTALPKESVDEEEQSLAPDENHRGKHWREDKIGLLMRMTSQEKASDPAPEVPEAFVDPTRIVKLMRELKVKKSASVEEGGQEAASESASDAEEVQQLLETSSTNKAKWQPPEVKDKHLSATRRPWKAFGPMVAQLAWSLGFYEAPRKAFLGDGSENNWAIWRKHFSSFVPILDIIHAMSYVYAASMADRRFSEGWQCYERWLSWVWQGEVEQVIAELAQRQAELGSPEKGDGETHPRKIVATALGYLQNHKEKMRYPEYRRLGLPITSSYVESAVKQFNQRVKGTEKFWTEEGAEALLQLRADYLGPDCILDEFWEARQDNATGQANYSLTV